MTDNLDVGRLPSTMRLGVWNQLGCPAPDKIPYCCVPRCKSSSKQRTPGISFHEIPSDPELRAKWLKIISWDDWTPNTTSCYSTVCSRDFGSSDFKEGCKIRKLKKDAVPSIFEEYPGYLQPQKNRERSDASLRKREAAAPVHTPPLKRRAVESQLESPSLPLNDLPSVDVASQELSLMDCSATELPLPLENSASERCITTTVQVNRAVQVSSLFSVSAMDKRKWRRKERDLNARNWATEEHCRQVQTGTAKAQGRMLCVCVPASCGESERERPGCFNISGTSSEFLEEETNVV
ncbi:hypothetical protein HPB49_012872 [Dermacentor silvarum]|uniref:Uncharacterized protein n=1 Tax=Dermacentor silvarum TaxID=543639 RepID=A0ACB8DD40_DERSI|nr:hypothetical protein HPB49_012872 [Dermacentor silvarum]